MPCSESLTAAVLSLNCHVSRQWTQTGSLGVSSGRSELGFFCTVINPSSTYIFFVSIEAISHLSAPDPVYAPELSQVIARDDLFISV